MTEQTTEEKQIETRLSLAQGALDVNDLEKALAFFKKAEEVEWEYPERERLIRQSLIKYSDQIISKTPPDWKLAHQALKMLDTDVLSLHDKESLAWQQELKFREVEFRLDGGELDSGFGIFKNLITEAKEPEYQDKLKVDISRRVCAYVVNHLPERRWLFLSGVIERLKPFGSSTDEAHDWPETISQILIAADQAQTEMEQSRQQAQTSGEKVVAERDLTVQNLNQTLTQVQTSLEKAVADRDLTIQQLNQTLAQVQSEHQEATETISTQKQQVEQLVNDKRRYRNLSRALWFLLGIFLVVAFIVLFSYR